MTRTEFLRWAAEHTPWTPPPPARIPDEWWEEVEAVWTSHFEVFDNLCQSLRKMGGHIWVSAAGLQEYSRTLTVEEQVRLFLAIRNQYPTLEPVFRPEFERGFPASVGVLPAPFTATELLQREAEVQARSLPRDEPY